MKIKTDGMLKAVQGLVEWHQIIDSYNPSKESLYLDLIKEERDELLDAKDYCHIVKEAADLIVVASPLLESDDEIIRLHAKSAYSEGRHVCDLMMGSWAQAIIKVNESNFSKFFPKEEIDNAKAHFANLGINVVIEHLGSVDLYAAKSSVTQTINGTTYKEGKILKGHLYKDIDTTVEWWL